EEFLAGRSHECDYPPTVQNLPACSEPKFNIHGTSREIDERVKNVVRESLSVYRVDVERLKQLRPDVIVTQDHCEVCAVSLKDVERATCDWLGAKVKIVALRPNALEDVFSGIQEVALALGAPEKGEALIANCRQRMAAVAAKASRQPDHPSVACIEWIDPLMAAGNWVPELVHMLGAKDLLGKPGDHSPWMTWEQLRDADPDFIVVMPCGWDIKRSRPEMKILTQKPGWQSLKAVRQGRVYLTDGNQYFNRPGPRLVESLEILAEIFYPKFFQPGHEHSGWKIYDIKPITG
ncbi:MAG: cobalamin-binding protein, partial [Candidatus Omnitrophica bacterium]|nr:cobalamin-binding protein [Candidatus Omnitrophota bacterium]